MGCMDALDKRKQQVVYDKKWHVLRQRAGMFVHIPFVEFAFGAGSLAIGNVRPESDFDILIGARKGRIFTARFFAIVFFALRGWRRSRLDHHDLAADKICLNHFVTPASYRLRLPPNAYWQLLYSQLVPLYGHPERIQAFYDANRDWMHAPRVIENDLRYQYMQGSWLQQAIELLLDGSIGDWLEGALKTFQVRRIESGIRLATGTTVHHMKARAPQGVVERIELAPLIVYTDEELEFHPDPAVIEIGGAE